MIIYTVLSLVLIDLMIVIYTLVKGLIRTYRNKVYRVWLVRRQINANYAYNVTNWRTRKLRVSVRPNRQSRNENVSPQISV